MTFDVTRNTKPPPPSAATDIVVVVVVVVVVVRGAKFIYSVDDKFRTDISVSRK